MSGSVITQFVNNAALLLALCVVYEFSYYIPEKFKKFNPYINGFLIGMIGVFVMTMPFKLNNDIIFDTRSILISVAALTFGAIPTLIAVVITVIYRVIIDGTGGLAGVSVIIVSAVIGLLWRRYLLRKNVAFRWLNIYLFGITVHAAMLACMFILPLMTALSVLKEISLPVMLVYPVGTVLLSLLLLRQKERNESLLRVAEDEVKYKNVFENSHAIMILNDPEDHLIIDANPAASEFYGWPVETMKAMKINTLTWEEPLAEAQNSINDKRDHFTSKHMKASGQIVDVEIYNSPVMFNGRKRVFSIIHDITKRAIADRELQDSEKRFRLLVESAPDAIFIIIAGKFAFMNNATVSLFGAESEDRLIGLPIMDLIHPDYRKSVQERMRELDQGGKSVPPNEEVFLKMDGTQVYADVAASPIYINMSLGHIVFARDIGERKKFESVRNIMQAQLKQQQKLESIGILAGGVAQEISNPINGIMNYAQLILDESKPNSEQAEYAGEIINETERISVIVKNLLQFSKPENQSYSYTSIYDLINRTVLLFKPIIKKDRITLYTILDDDLPNLKCRNQQIQQVIMCLLTNALDALNEKYPDYDEDKIIRLLCSQYIEAGRRWIRIIVEDHGIGIKEELRDRIFEPFFTTKPQDKRTGLGLSTSFGIVKNHHGNLTFETKDGGYTRFILDLPVDDGGTI